MTWSLASRTGRLLGARLVYLSRLPSPSRCAVGLGEGIPCWSLEWETPWRPRSRFPQRVSLPPTPGSSE